jgi:hypothetical protein
MVNTNKIKSLLICVLLVGSMLILNSEETAAQAIGGTVYEDVNMNGIFDAGEGTLTGADLFLDYPAGVTTVSGGGGAYNFATTMGFHWVTVKMPGYKTVTKNINVTGAMTVNFGLVPFESITGRARKTDGTGVVGMHIEVYDQAFAFIQETFTDAFGNYCIHGLPPGVYHLRAMKAEYYDHWKYNIAVDGMTIAGTMYNWHTTPNINFTNLSYDHGMIFGTVSDLAGPLPGAVVEVPGLGLSTTTDAFGNYMIHNIPAGYYYVIVKKTGYQTGVEFICVTNGTTGPTGPINFIVDASSGLPLIEGTVTDGIQAIENALVEIPGLGWSYGTTLELYTDKAGYYIFTDYPTSNTYAPHPLGPGKYTVVVRNEAGVTTDESDNHHKTNARTVVAQMNRETRADFKLEENYGIKFGRVINTDGIGVEGAKVFVPHSPYTTVTDSNGVFALELPSETYSEDCDPGTDILPYQTMFGFDEMTYCGMVDTFQLGVVTPLPTPESGNPHRMHKAQYLIKVEKANYITTLEYYIPVPGGPGLLNPPDPCELCVNGIVLNYKTGILKGQVYDGTGLPVTNGFVFVAGRDVPLQANGWFETHNVPVGTYTAAVIDPTRTILGTKTGIHIFYDQVTYEVINLGPTPTTNYISGFIYSNKVRLDVTGDTIPDTNGYSAGAAFDPGEGIPGVTVETTATYTAVTDTYGFYCIIGIPTATTSTTIVATKSGYITIANPFVTPVSTLSFFPGFAGTAGATVSPMSKFRGSLSGRVTNEEGRDVSGAVVSIWEPAEIMDETDTNGFYIFEDVEYGTYLIKVCGGGLCGIDYLVTFSKGSPFQPVVVDGNVTKDITVEKVKGRVEGMVDDGANPIQDVTVRVSGKYSSSTDTPGYYTVLNVPSGTHTAYAFSYGYQLQKHNNTDQSIGIAGGQVFTANFTLTPGLMNTGWIEGYITLELTDGFCDVVARLNPSFDFALTDSEGYYLITGIGTGAQYYVHGEKANYSTMDPAGPLAVNAGVGTWAPPIHMKRCTGTIDGYITDSQTFVPISGATVILSDMNRNNDVSYWYPGSDYYTDYGRSQIYQTTTDSIGYYQFTDVPWSDANTSGVNKTWAWTVVVTQIGYEVGVSNAAVVCGGTSTVSFAVDPLCAIAGSVTFDLLCATSATVTATQIAGGTEGAAEFGWSSSGTDDVTTSGSSYYIGHLQPGAYDVTATAGTCSMIGPVIPYTGAYSIPANYKVTTPNIDFNFGTSMGSGLGSGGSKDNAGEEESNDGSGADSGESNDGSGADSGEGESGRNSPNSGGDTNPPTGHGGTSEQTQSSTSKKLLMEVALDAIQQAKALKNQVNSILDQKEDIPETIKYLLSQANSYLEEAITLYEQSTYMEALKSAEKAIQYYQELLQILT